MNFYWNQKPFTGAMKYGRNYALTNFRPSRPQISVTLKFYVFSALGDLPSPFDLIFRLKVQKTFFSFFLLNLSTYVFRMTSKFCQNDKHLVIFAKQVWTCWCSKMQYFRQNNTFSLRNGCKPKTWWLCLVMKLWLSFMTDNVMKVPNMLLNKNNQLLLPL